MITPVSFGSTYKVTSGSKETKRQQIGYNRLIDYCELNHIPFIEDSSMQVKKPYSSTTYSANASIVADDLLDKNIDSFMQYHGIKYTKHSTDSFTTPASIESRTTKAPDGFAKVYVDTEKLNALMAKSKNSNYKHCKSDYEKYYSDQLDCMVKSGKELPATTLYITPVIDKNDLIHFINDWGADNIDDSLILFDFAQKTENPDHCMYFKMLESGMKQIPIYVNKDSYEIGKALGIME